MFLGEAMGNVGSTILIHRASEYNYSSSGGVDLVSVLEDCQNRVDPNRVIDKLVETFNQSWSFVRQPAADCIVLRAIP